MVQRHLFAFGKQRGSSVVNSQLPQWPLQLAFIPKRCTSSQRKSLLNEIHWQAQNPDSPPALLWAYIHKENQFSWLILTDGNRYKWPFFLCFASMFLKSVWFSAASDLQPSSYPAPHVAVTLNGLSIVLVCRIFLYLKEEKKSNCNLRLIEFLSFFPAGTTFLFWVYGNTNEAT